MRRPFSTMSLDGHGRSCPACGGPLEARNRLWDGRKKRSYFAHAQDRECAGAFETAVHRMAKQVLLDADQLMLPAWTRQTVRLDPDQKEHAISLKRPDMVWGFERVEAEV